MKLVVQDKRIISSLQQDFNILFPFLRIEFYCMNYSAGNTIHKQRIISGDTSLEECRTVAGEHLLTIMPRMSVRELVNAYQELFGIHVSVFRLSGKAWIETTVTDEWTLKEQNEYGKELSERKRLEVA